MLKIVTLSLHTIVTASPVTASPRASRCGGPTTRIVGGGTRFLPNITFERKAKLLTFRAVLEKRDGVRVSCQIETNRNAIAGIVVDAKVGPAADPAAVVE